MEKTQKIVVALLIVAILFSGVSIFTSFIALNFDLPDSGVSAQSTGLGNGNGNINFVVEDNTSGETG